MLSRSLPLDARNMCCSTRISSGTVAVSDLLTSSKGGSCHFAGVKSARMEATASLSGPCMDDFAIDGNGHRVLSIDTLNLAPVKTVATEGIYYRNAFISNVNNGAMHDQVANYAYTCCDNTGYQTCCQAAGVEGLKSNSSKKEVTTPRSNNAACGSEFLTVNHRTIVTQGAKNV